MSVRMALAKLCACTCGGAIIGGGAVHVAESARPAVVHSSKSTKAAPKKRYAVRTVKRKVVKTAMTCAPQMVTVTSQQAPIPLPMPIPMAPAEMPMMSGGGGAVPIVMGGGGGFG
ncbi:hypothetical protein OSJ57_20580, partial [Sphingomonas sp. HH69]